MESMTGIHVRPASVSDTDEITRLYIEARRAAEPIIPPSVHGADATRAWIGQRLASDGPAFVAEVPDSAPAQIVGFMVLDGPFVDQLYVRPGLTGRGIGAVLLSRAQALFPDGLFLWTFARNVRAQRFYERHGFRAVEWTDGSHNEERTPDVRMVWRDDPRGWRSLIPPAPPSVDQ